MQILPYVEFVGGCRGVPRLDGELDVLEALLELSERHEGGGAVCGGGGKVLSLVRGRVDGRVAHGLRVEDDRQLVVPRLEGRVVGLLPGQVVITKSNFDFNSKFELYLNFNFKL